MKADASPPARLLRPADGLVVCPRLEAAEGLLARLRGLLGRKSLEPGSGLLLEADAIHTCFMAFAIDVVFLDRDLAVRRVVRDLKPWRMACCRKADLVVELPAGACPAGLREGDRLALEHA